MTDKVGRWVSSHAWQIGGALLTIGIAWGLLTAAVSSMGSDKLDASRFVADSIRRDAETNGLRTGQDTANARLRRIECHLVPQTLGCQRP